MLAVSAAGTAVSAMGTIAGGRAQAAAGQAQANAMNFQAAQQEQAATQARAEAQRVALDKRREGRFTESTLIARAAMGGGGVDDPTTLNLGGDIAGRSEYDALMEMYKGENRARGMEDQAAASRMSGQAALAGGQAAQSASGYSAAGTIISGAGSMYGTYARRNTAMNGMISTGYG